jgi:hypothetical protein
VREFPLDGDETIVEFTSNALEDVPSEIPREKRERVLDKLIEVAESPKPERYVDYFRGCEKLGKIYIDGELRTICCLVTRLPGYELIPVFAITEHDYSRLQDHDRKAVSAVERLSDLETEAAVSDYVEGRPNTFDADDLRTLRGELVDG